MLVDEEHTIVAWCHPAARSVSKACRVYASQAEMLTFDTPALDFLIELVFAFPDASGY